MIVDIRLSLCGTGCVCARPALFSLTPVSSSSPNHRTPNKEFLIDDHRQSMASTCVNAAPTRDILLSGAAIPLVNKTFNSITNASNNLFVVRPFCRANRIFCNVVVCLGVRSTFINSATYTNKIIGRK